MKKLIILTVIVVSLISCSKKEKELPPVEPGYIVQNLASMPYYADTLLPAEFLKHKVIRKGEVKTVRADELFTSDSTQADYYLNHHFVGVTSGTYTMDDNTITVEIIQFADEIKAYGFYASYRTHGIQIDKIGAESFQIGNSRYMVKADYVLILSANEKTEKTMNALKDFSIDFDNRILGSKSTPPFFLLFPFSSKIIPSQKYYPYQYLGIPGLDEVYTTSYLIGTDTMTLFLTMDQSGNKFKYLQKFARQNGEVVESFKRFSFDSTFSLAFKDSTNGVIVAGIKSQKLIGTIKYNPKAVDKHLKGWIKGL